MGPRPQTMGESSKNLTMCGLVADPAAEQVPGADELIAWCRERLAHFKCPREVHFLAELPRNATGKLLKTELRRRFTGVEGGVVQR